MKVVFMGTPAPAVVSLQRLLADGHEIVAAYTQPDKPAGRGNKVAQSPVKMFSLEHGIDVYQPLQIKTDEVSERFCSHAADVVVVVAYGRILPEAFLKAFRYGAVNLHFSLLPKYRGAAPVNWAIVNGEKETGVTTMKMDTGLDTGPILLQRSAAIGDDETGVELMERLAHLGADLLSETLERIDDLEQVTQDDAAASLAPLMKKSDGLIDWSMTAVQIANRVRGFQPFPTAYTTHRGGRLTVWKARHAGEQSGRPGEVIEAAGDKLTVSCGHGSSLRLVEIQPEGKRRMSARDFLNGAKAEVGEIFG
ncbi:MAG: methionyl-tRNA formyltransferase [Chloracidobacterium sp.]|nr:methionyl-tRNA formyltransferase [Chloracidobacterium sp.]